MYSLNLAILSCSVGCGFVAGGCCLGAVCLGVIGSGFVASASLSPYVGIQNI